MRSTAFFKLYKICILLHRCNLKNFRKKSVRKNSNFREISAKHLQMSQNLQNVVKFQKIQLENLVDFEKCCKTHIFLQKSEPIQPKTSNILPKFCQPTLSDVSSRSAECEELETASGDGDVLQGQSSNSRIAGCLQFWGIRASARPKLN